MTTTLLSLTKYNDSDLLSARWLDDAFGIDYEFNAVHTADGRPLARTEDCPAPVLTAEQLSQAQPFQPPQHPAYDLADLGIARHPDWSNRYLKAAELVEAGRVRLLGEIRAVVTGSSNTYAVNITSKQCTCPWMQHHPGDPCSHYLAARMALALNQEAEPLTEAEKEAACAARRQANKDAMARRIAGRGPNKFEETRRARRQSGEGARLYWRMAYANGRMTITPEIAQRAQPGTNGGNR